MDNNCILKMRNKIIMVFGIFLLVALSLNVNAAGISSPYWDENPLYVKAGDVKEFNYLMQNMVGDEDLKMQVSLEGTSGIMQFVENKSIYSVPLRSSDVPVKMRVIVPTDAKEGDEWEVGVRFTTISSNTEGKPVVIGSAFSKGFRVIVEKQKIEENVNGNATKVLMNNKLIGFIILVIVLLILVFTTKYFYKKKNK